MAKLKNHQVKASTLLEVIVAMVIILIVFVFATQIYTNVIRSSPSLKYQHARAAAESVMESSMQEDKWEDEVVQIDSMELDKKVETYKGYQDLYVLKIRVHRNGEELGVFNTILKKKRHD